MSPEELVEIRKGVKFSQQHFSDRMGVGIRTYQKWESGERPIRPMVAQCIRNVEELVRTESKAKQAKAISEKSEVMRESLSAAILGLKELGAHTKSSDRLLDLLVQNRAPSKEEVGSLFLTLESPVQLSANTQAIVRVLFKLAIQNSENDDSALESFRLLLSENLDGDEYAQLISWAEKHYLMTSPDVVKSMFKAISKQMKAA
ncbi:MAG: helix-turn-helix domain-containing protein [Hafnia sp.]